MGCFSYNLFSSSPPCQVPVTGSFACQFKTPPYKQLPTLFKQKKKHFNGCQRASRVVSYYALKTPPYKLDALEPYMSKRTVEVHWKEHHGAYVEGLNKALAKSDILYGYTLDDLVKVTYNNGNPSRDFNNAAQVWNHDFFWESMQPGGGDMPELGMLEQIEKDFGSFTNFRNKFAETALTLFGSGWVWLVLIKKRDLAKIIDGGGRYKSTITRVPGRFSSSIVYVVYHEWLVQLLPPLGKGTFPTWSFKRGQSFPHRRRCRTFAPEIFTPSCEVEEKSRPEPSSFDARGSSSKVYSNGMSM